MSTTITSTLSEEAKVIAGAALQQSLVDLIDLGLVAKQAHWNVVGSQFRSVHLQLDELVTDTRTFADAVAERATAIGVSPDGRAETVAKSAATKGVDDGWLKDVDVVAGVVANLAAVVAGLRTQLGAVGDVDSVTEDLLIGITARLEQLHWMWQAQQA